MRFRFGEISRINTKISRFYPGKTGNIYIERKNSLSKESTTSIKKK